jgi:RNA-splicing ligase RtcB
MAKFEVVVGNIGTVYSGNNFMQAQTKYSTYVKQSHDEYGRAAGEPVTLFHNGDIRSEYAGTLKSE